MIFARTVNEMWDFMYTGWIGNSCFFLPCVYCSLLHSWLWITVIWTIICSLVFQRRAGDDHHSLLVIQCDSGHLNSDLIACARYRIYDKKAEATQQNEGEGCTHVLFIVYHPRQVGGSSFVGFQGDPWISTHIDNLRTKDNTITLHEAMGASISQLFYGKDTDSEEREAPNKTATLQLFSDAAQLPVERCYNAQFRRLNGCNQKAASRLQDSAQNKARATKRVAILVNLIPRNPSFPPGMQNLYVILIIHTIWSVSS